MAPVPSAITLAVRDEAGPASSEDLVRSLQTWLHGDGDLPVRLMEAPPSPGELGAWTESLAVILAPGGAAAVLAGSLVSWLRRRRSDLTVKLRRVDGAEIEVSVTQLRRLDSAELSQVVGSLRGWLDWQAPPSPGIQIGSGDGDDGTSGEPR
jgi:hypothetical protein